MIYVLYMLYMYYTCVGYISKLFRKGSCPFAHFLDPHQSLFEGSEDPPGHPVWIFKTFISSKHQVILDQLMFNWFLGHINSFWGSYIMLTPQNISESIWNGPYLVKRLVVNISNYTMNRLNHPKLPQTLRYDT